MFTGKLSCCLWGKQGLGSVSVQVQPQDDLNQYHVAPCAHFVLHCSVYVCLLIREAGIRWWAHYSRSPCSGTRFSISLIIPASYLGILVIFCFLLPGARQVADAHPHLLTTLGRDIICHRTHPRRPNRLDLPQILIQRRSYLPIPTPNLPTPTPQAVQQSSRTSTPPPPSLSLHQGTSHPRPSRTRPLVYLARERALRPRAHFLTTGRARRVMARRGSLALASSQPS